MPQAATATPIRPPPLPLPAHDTETSAVCAFAAQLLAAAITLLQEAS